MNRYSFVIGQPAEVIKDATKRKVGRVKKAMVKQFGKNSIREKVLATPISSPRRRRRRRAPRLTFRNDNCVLCGFHIEDDQPIHQTLCDRCDATIRQKEIGTDDGFLHPWFVAFLIACVSFTFTWMWIHK